MKHPTAEERAMIAAEVKAGATVEDVAKKYKRSPVSVIAYVKNNGGDRKRDSRIAGVVAMARTGKSVKYLATLFKASPSTVSTWCARAGIVPIKTPRKEPPEFAVRAKKMLAMRVEKKLSLDAIASKVGLTRERVRQILTHRFKLTGRVKFGVPWVQYKCKLCGCAFERHPKANIRGTYGFFCSRKCRRKHIKNRDTPKYLKAQYKRINEANKERRRISWVKLRLARGFKVGVINPELLKLVPSN